MKQDNCNQNDNIRFKRFNGEAKKINKNKELDFNKRVNLVFERKKFIDNTCPFRNKN